MPLRRLVILVGIVVCVDTAFFAVVAPLLPRYADELDLSKLSAGILTAAYPAGTILGALPAGLVAARIGPRAVVVCGLTLLAASSLVFGLSRHEVVLDAARLVQGVGGACSWAGGLAWIAAEAPADRRGALIGSALGAAIFGTLLGPVLGALAAATSPRAVFVGGAVLGSSLALVAARAPAAHRARPEPHRALARVLGDADVRLGMWLVALPAIGFGALDVLVPLHLHGLGFGGIAVGAVFLGAAAVESAESPIVGRLSDRHGRMLPIRVGLVAAVVTLVLQAAASGAAPYVASFIACVGAFGVFWAPAMALLSDAAERGGVDQGIAFGLVTLAWGLGAVAGAGAGGAIAKVTGDALPLALCAVSCAATLVAIRRAAPAAETEPATA